MSDDEPGEKMLRDRYPNGRYRPLGRRGYRFRRRRAPRDDVRRDDDVEVGLLRRRADAVEQPADQRDVADAGYLVGRLDLVVREQAADDERVAIPDRRRRLRLTLADLRDALDVGRDAGDLREDVRGHVPVGRDPWLDLQVDADVDVVHLLRRDRACAGNDARRDERQRVSGEDRRRRTVLREDPRPREDLAVALLDLRVEVRGERRAAR